MSDNVINFRDKKTESVEEKKREFERVVFNSFMGSYSVVDENGGCYQIELVDISHDGMMFQVPWSKGNEKTFKIDNEMTLRIYFTRDSYLPIVVNIKHATEYIDSTGTYMRYGCQMDKETSSYQALKPFIEFIYKYAENSVVDKGDEKVYFL